MITLQEFQTIDNEVKASLKDALESIKSTNISNYVLLLAEGEFRSEFIGLTPKISPYTIDYRPDILSDLSRSIFLTKFLQNYYTFPISAITMDDDEYRLHMELMIYTHIWESKPFLKKLFRIACTLSGQEYPWLVKVPEMSKHTFIRSKIIQRFQSSNSSLSEIIRKGFHTSLRNAFAHSDYFFDTMNRNDRIVLNNYNGASWELKNIGFDDWSKRFSYSVLLSYHLFDIIQSSRKDLYKDFNTKIFRIKHYSTENISRDVGIVYEPDHDVFNFQIS